MRTHTRSSAERRPSQPTISRVAVGVNGTSEGQDAVALGAALAGVAGAELMLVAVHPEPLVVLPEEMNWTSLEAQATSMLRKIRQTFAPSARIVVETDFSVPRALERVARREHSDLLVVGSSRLADDETVRIGKRARQLLGEAGCAVAIAPRGFHNRPEGELSRIGVGFDGGRESYAALSLAASIAGAAGAKLTVCGVVDDRVPPLTLPDVAAGFSARWQAALEARADGLRELGLAAVRDSGEVASVEIARGRPADALLSLSAEVDLLVIGSRCWGPVARLVLGSTGEALAHGAASPLLIVPRPAT